MVLKWSKYDKDLLVVPCDKDKFENFFDALDGEWYNKTHFFVSVKKESELDRIIDFINIEEMKSLSVKYDTPVDKISFYKTFAKKPADFRKIHDVEDEEEDENNYSSSSYGSSSSDGFPSPETPGIKEYNPIQLYEIITDLKNRVRNLEKTVYE